MQIGTSGGDKDLHQFDPQAEQEAQQHADRHALIGQVRKFSKGVSQCKPQGNEPEKVDDQIEIKIEIQLLRQGTERISFFSFDIFVGISR